jgi:hypothetical protein
VLASELGLLLARVGDAARAHQGRIALIGILPTSAGRALMPAS